ncbi:MAG: ORF6N domain-containing protein [Solirubrobacterales bacterium]
MELIATPAIEQRIFVIRGRQVMLDEDLADLYGVETKRLVEQVKRNLDRFPEDFMFQLNKDEAAALRSQIATSNTGRSDRSASESGMVTSSQGPQPAEFA